ncbi:hypothetical protein PIB30_113405, partial [Stylosanthes scabra]|nr:hypothetical protein [Stylosanthes scabra]
ASNENEDLKKTNNELQKENEIDRLNASLAKFNQSSKNLDKILSNQKHAKDREGIGYDVNKASSSKNKKVKETIRQPQANKANK